MTLQGAISLLLALYAVQVAWPAHADLLPVDLFEPGDELATYDTETGLEWLDLDLTKGLSLGDVAAGAGGWAAANWRPAETAEVCNLINRYAATLDPCPQQIIPDVEPTPEIDALIALLEPTEVHEFERVPGKIELGLAAVGVFLASEDKVGLAGVADANFSWYVLGFTDRALIFAADGFEAGPDDPTNPDRGLFLVRPLPEPNSQCVLATGIAMIAALRRRTVHNHERQQRGVHDDADQRAFSGAV